ncbi:MAG: ABC transporter ATP-binding protein, partial [Bacteroidia bacterium]|nr:ABC transporter ATP-binding protein [Bacteroidia bacterium]
MIPILNLLFDAEESSKIPPLPEFSLTMNYVTDTFQHYFLTFVQREGATTTLLYVFVLVIASTLLANLFRYMERMAASRMKVDIVKNIRMDIFDHVSLLHIGYFNEQRRGDLISRFTNDVSEVENAVVNSLKFVLKEPITIILTFGVLFSISVKLTLITLIVLPVTGGVVAEIVKRLKRRATQSQESLGRIVNILDEMFGGMRVVKAFNARKFIGKKIDSETAYHRKVNLSISRKNELASPVSETLGVIIMAALFYYGGQEVLKGNSELSAGAFLGFLALFASIIQPAKNFSNGITSLQKGMVSAGRIFSLIDTPSAIQNKPGALKVENFSKGIEFKNVSFAYEKEHVLKHINLTIEK